ncbi:MAG: DUF2179 domain-containing protein [Planctomycetaceae bacterium]|nr:DUF2179 domain-containing protein [Planctomycetaceae bacterium]
MTIFETFSGSPLFSWLLLPLFILCARICDVTIGTARVIFVSRGYRVLAACAGFFEVLIWLTAIGQIMTNLTNPACYVAYASGFAIGNFIGITLTEKLSLGVVLIRIITNQNASKLVEAFKQSEYGVTCIEGTGAYGSVNIVFTVVPRRNVTEIIDIIKTFNPQAFYTIEEIGSVSASRFMAPRSLALGPAVLLRPFRKGK